MSRLAALTIYDEIGVEQSSITMGYVLDLGAAHLIPELDRAAGRVVQKWELLGGRVRKDYKTGSWFLHRSAGESATHSFTTSSSSTSLQPPSVHTSTSFIESRPQKFLFRNAATSTSLASYARSGSPLLAIHCSVLRDAVCVGISLPHGIFDATGMGFVVYALDAELAGRAWDVPDIGDGLFAAINEAADEDGGTFESYAALRQDLVPPTILAWMGILATLFWEFVWGWAETRQVFLSRATVEHLVGGVKDTVRKETSGQEWVSTGDCLMSWILKAVHRDSISSTKVTLASVFSIRTMLPPLSTYPLNAAVQFSLPHLTSREIASSPLSTLALLHRRTLDSARRLSFLKSHTKWLQDTRPVIRRVLGEQSWIFTNQTIARLPAFSAMGPVRAFWLYESPILIDHAVAINEVEEGFILICVLRRREWAKVQKAVDELVASSGT